MHPPHSQGISLKSRRLDSHQHKPVYKTGAFLSRATSAEAVVAAAQARGFEPRLSVLEADCSPRSTLVEIGSRVTERNRTAAKQIHSLSPETSTGSGHSGRQGSRTLKARRPHGLANRPGKPYSATFLISGPHGSRTHHTDLARISRHHRHASPLCCVTLRHAYFIERSPHRCSKR